MKSLADIRPPPRPRIKRISRTVLCLSATFAFATAHASGPEVALRYRSADVLEAQEELRLEREELARANLGVGGSLELRPYLEYDQNLLDPSAAPSFGPGIEGTASVGYTYDPPRILLATIEALQAEGRLSDARRESVRAALMAYTDLLNAQLTLRVEQADFADNLSGLAEAQSGYAAGEATETELAMAQLGVDSGKRTLAYAQSTLADVRERVARYGLEGPTSFVPLKFALPEISFRQTLDYRIAELEAARTQALALQSSVYAVVDEVRLGTRYYGEDYELSGGLGLEQGRPSVDASVRYRNRDPDDWAVRLEATFRLDDTTADDFASQARSAEGTQRDLQELSRDLAEQLRDAREDAAFAGGTVDIGVRDLRLIDRRIEELEAQLETVPERLSRQQEELDGAQRQLDGLRNEREAQTDPAEQGVLDAEIAALEAALSERQTELSETEQERSGVEATLEQYREFRELSESNLYRAWADYLSSVDSYLALSDGSWQSVTP